MSISLAGVAAFEVSPVYLIKAHTHLVISERMCSMLRATVVLNLLFGGFDDTHFQKRGNKSDDD